MCLFRITIQVAAYTIRPLRRSVVAAVDDDFLEVDVVEDDLLLQQVLLPVVPMGQKVSEGHCQSDGGDQHVKDQEDLRRSVLHFDVTVSDRLAMQLWAVHILYTVLTGDKT